MPPQCKSSPSFQNDRLPTKRVSVSRTNAHFRLNSHSFASILISFERAKFRNHTRSKLGLKIFEYLWGMRERFGDSCGLLMSSNSLELLRNIGMLDFLSPCLIDRLDLISGEINFDSIFGGFINETLGVLCSVVSSCSSIFALLPAGRSFFFVFTASDDGTSSSCLLESFSIRLAFVRSLVNFSRWIDSLLAAVSSHGSSFAELLHSPSCSISSLATGAFRFDVSPSMDLAVSFLFTISQYSWWRDGRLRYSRNSGDFLAADQRVGGPITQKRVSIIQ